MISSSILYIACLITVCHAGAKEEKAKGSKKDLVPAETRVGPILPYGDYDGYEPGLAYSGALGPAVIAPGYGHGLGLGHRVGHGLNLGYPNLIQKPLGYVDGYGHNDGYLKAGISEGALALGGQGAHLYKVGNDGRYADGSFNEGGGSHDSGYQGLEGYKDNKHHIADDFANRQYYNGAQGIRKDLGNGQVFDKSQGFTQNSHNTVGDNELQGHKKGHHKTGFKKSYHKDESGNDESFYDVDHDEGNHEYGKLYGDKSGSNYATNLNGAHKINEFDTQQHGRNGYEGNGKLVALNQGLKDYYGGNGYYNNGKKFGALAGGQSSNFGKYGLQNGYRDNFNNGRNFEDYQGSKYGSGAYGPGPYGY